MSTLTKRLERLEARATATRSGGGWIPPIVENRPGDDPAEIERRVEAIRQEALAAGWRPRHGPYVILVDLTAKWPDE
jgi:hypothetical protein